MESKEFFNALIRAQKTGADAGICSICSANKMVIEAAMEIGRDEADMVLIEATSNQVNQFGGYTGMRPADFAAYARAIAEKVGLLPVQLILGGDHLGPLTWASEPASAAMEKAETLVAEFVRAGFTKIHLDASMRLGDDSPTERLEDAVIADRAARLCAAAEEAVQDGAQPVYVIGSEVPIPGGATENEDDLNITSPDDLRATLAAFHDAFVKRGLDEAWERVIAVVVQPGVEFADNTIIAYDPVRAKDLTQYASTIDHMVLEGHSTDYQPRAALRQMRADGIAILKVGPALTFALREALFALEAMERILYPFSPPGGYSRFSDVLEQTLMTQPQYWQRYYHGSVQDVAFARRFSLSDRCRYYLEETEIAASIQRLICNVNDATLSYGLISQFFPGQKEQLVQRAEPVSAERLIKEHIKEVIRSYC